MKIEKGIYQNGGEGGKTAPGKPAASAALSRPRVSSSDFNTTCILWSRYPLSWGKGNWHVAKDQDSGSTTYFLICRHLP